MLNSKKYKHIKLHFNFTTVWKSSHKMFNTMGNIRPKVSRMAAQYRK